MSEIASTAPPATEPVRDFTLRSAFALAFSDVSPIVGIYSVRREGDRRDHQPGRGPAGLPLARH